MNITSIFITGLFAGGLTCLAVQGGLLASSIAQSESDKLENNTKKTGHIVPVVSFLVARLLAYSLLGLLLGTLGSVAQLSLQVRVFLQFAVGIFMIGTALNLLNVHPIFRYFVVQPPRFLTRLVKNQSRSKSVFGPAILGGMTVLIPCGATQAMMAYAITTGSPLSGAITMFVFILGTSPLFFILGYAAKQLGTVFSSKFNVIAAIAIILVAGYNISGALALTGTDLSLGTNAPTNGSKTVSSATIYFMQDGYKLNPQTVSVKAGARVMLNLVNETGGGCIQAFTIPKLNIQRVVGVGKSEEVTFTAPKETGPLAFMCSMGMYRGVINVM